MLRSRTALAVSATLVAVGALAYVTPSNGRTFGSARADVPGALAWSGGVVVGGATEGALATTLDPDGLREAFVLRFPDGAP